ncbi:MAG: GC-type dockerin domain-anchored protein, partial [Planctomycetota bacterium]
LTAWGLGNSRWSNASSVPASLIDPKPLSRSHLLGLREARPERDGGLIVLNFGATDFIGGIDLEGDVSADLFSNWTRFGYGGSFASSPGTGAPGHLGVDGSAVFLNDLVGDPGNPAPTQSLALLLERPRGGTVLLDMYVADADGTGRILTADATPLPGTVGPINTDTTRVERVITAVSATTVDVEGDTSAIEPGDALVGEDDTVVNVVESVEGQTVHLRFAWTVEPAVGTTAAFGTVGYRLAGYTFDAPASESPRRGLQIQHAGGGRVTLTGVGIRSLDPNRICYVLGGRGGLGQAQQAEREAPGTLAAMSDVLGVELFFTGLATQSDDTLGALEAQLGDRLLTAEFIGTPDVINAQSNTLGSQDAAETHAEVLDGARRYDAWAYFQIQDEFPGMLEQYMALLRHDPAHPNGRGMLAAAELWWSRLEATADTLLTNDGCPADVNRDRQVNPADFNAWVIAFNNGNFAADQNGDAVISPADFNGWVINYNAGCP